MATCWSRLGDTEPVIRHSLVVATSLFLVVGCSDSSTRIEPLETSTTTAITESGETTVDDDSSSTTAVDVSSAVVPANADVPAWGECPNAVFPDLSAVAGPGGEYAMPVVTVECTADEIVVSSNGMPSYTFVEMTPNGLEAQDYEWHVPLRPEMAAAHTSIVNVLGTLGFTTTGLPIYGPTEGPQPAAEAFGDPVYNGLLDDCGGHTGFDADYHNHALRSEAACNLDSSYIVGYALDGFPIFNSVGCVDVECTETAVFHSGYVMTGDPTSNSWDAYTYDPAASEGGDTNVLDECNGRVGPDGTYRYHATSAFPYIIGCHVGTATPQTGAAAQPMPPMGGPPGGPPPR